jgi:hypothetical protein
VIGEDRGYRIGSAAVWLARDLAACQVLIAGEPVARSRLYPERLCAIGESTGGDPLILDDRLALRVEGVRLSENDDPRTASASAADDPYSRTNVREAASSGGIDVHDGVRTTPGQTPPPLALENDILALFRADLRQAGVAGEERLASLVYLALTSRVLPWGKAAERPVSVLTKGTTSTGKSHTTQTVLRFFPPQAFVDLGSMSRRFLFYDEETYSHRFLIVPEWASIADDDELVALLRTLLSEGRIVHGTVEGEGKRKSRRIVKPGPTGLIVTTTEGLVDPEMETRCLSLTTDDSPEQTRAVFDVLADLEDETATPVDLQPWHDLQTWIAGQGEPHVSIPFVRALAKLMPVGATRLRRDFVSLLCLVRAHAILHQARRERDKDGRIVADLRSDYALVRDLVGALIAEGVEASVPESTRQTVDAVKDLVAEGVTHPSPKTIADRLGVGRSATYDRIRDALRRGYLVNESARNERGYKLALGADLPSAGEDFLPSVEAIVRFTSGNPSGQTLASTMRPGDVSSGCPDRPATPQVGRDLQALGESMYPVLIADAARDGQITASEFDECYALHKLVTLGQRYEGRTP